MDIYLENIKNYEQRAGGVTNYWYELSKRMLTSQEHIYLIENRFPLVNIFRSNLSVSDDYIRYERRFPVKILKYLPISVNLSGGILHSGYYRVSLQKDVINIVTVYDFIYEYFRSGLPKYVHHYQKQFAIKHSDGIICISNNTKSDLLKFYPYLDERRVEVIHLGVSDSFYRMDEVELQRNTFVDFVDSRFVMFVGERNGYKNFKLIVQALGSLVGYNLVIVGGPRLSGEEQQFLKATIPGRFFHLMEIDSRKLNVLYNSAFCLVYPSSYEGFGMPVVEAMKSGCPVVTTRSSSLPEICGNSALMVDSLNVQSFVKAIKELEDETTRASFVQSGIERSRFFNWDDTCAKTLAFYEKIYSMRM